jgi:hypothetical protein
LAEVVSDDHGFTGTSSSYIKNTFLGSYVKIKKELLSGGLGGWYNNVGVKTIIGFVEWGDNLIPMYPSFGNIIVPTAETTRQKFLLDLHVRAKKGILYVGTAGTGKSVIIRNYFGQVDPESIVSQSISMNSYTDSQAL